MRRGSHILETLSVLMILVIAAWISSIPVPSFGFSGEQTTAFDLSGKPVDPVKLADGKIVVLVFIRTDCPVSNRYAPTIQKLSEEFAGQARFWLVYPGKTESAEAIRKHQQEYRYRIPALRDPEHFLVKESHVEITPEVAVFAANGKIAYHGRIDNWYVDIGRARNAATTHELKEAIEAAIGGKSLEVAATHGVGCYISDLD